MRKVFMRYDPAAMIAAEGVTAVVEQLLEVLGAGGRLEALAIHTKPVALDITTLLTMQNRVLGSSIGCANDHPETIEFVRGGRVDLVTFVTSRSSPTTSWKRAWSAPPLKGRGGQDPRFDALTRVESPFRREPQRSCSSM